LDAATILETMRRFFEGKQPPEVMASFATQQPRALLTESLDVVDFVVYLEEELGREIDMQKVGAALLSNDFGDLSVAVSQLLATGE
jgi:acyl carrier protein